MFSVWLMATVTGLYTFSGGLTAVVFTDACKPEILKTVIAFALLIVAAWLYYRYSSARWGEMTFLFCDIAGFTNFVEQAQPAAVPVEQVQPGLTWADIIARYSAALTNPASGVTVQAVDGWLHARGVTNGFPMLATRPDLFRAFINDFGL